jgi:hypothetical protein
VILLHLVEIVISSLIDFKFLDIQDYSVTRNVHQVMEQRLGMNLH